MEGLAQENGERFRFLFKGRRQLTEAAGLRGGGRGRIDVTTAGFLERGDDLLPEGGNTLAGAGDDRQDGNSEGIAEFFGVNLVAIFFGDINHVERDKGRMAKFDDLG